MTKKTANKTKMIFSSLLAGGLLIGSAGCSAKAPGAANEAGKVRDADRAAEQMAPPQNQVKRPPRPHWIADDPAAKELLKAAYEVDLDALKAALAKGTPVDVKSNMGFTALMLAVISDEADIQEKKEKQLEIVKALIAAGSDVNYQDKDGDYALLIAAKLEAHAIETLLIGAGANPKLMNQDGESAAEIWEEIEEAEARGAANKAGAGEARDTNEAAAQEPIPPGKPAWAMPDDPAAEALLKAAFDGSLDDLKAALAKGTPVEAKSERGFTALNLAAGGNHPEAVKILIAAKADVNARDSNGHTPLQGCSRSDTHAEVVKLLIAAGADVNARDDTGTTAIEVASMSEGAVKVVNMLIAAGADVNAQDDAIGWTPLHYAVMYGHTEIVKALIAAGADVNKAIPAETKLRKKTGYAGGTTPLIHAASSNRTTEIAGLLIAAGADVNRADDRSWTPLLVAIDRKNTEMAVMFLKAGANPNHVNQKGLTALGPAAQMENAAPLVQMLIEAGADVNRASPTGATPLLAAADAGRIENVKLLIAAGADVNARYKDGRTALNFVAGQENPELISVLLQAGADAKTADDDGVTPLMRAADKGRIENVKLLLAAKADVNAARVSDGWTAIFWALGEQHWKIADALLDAGADVKIANKNGFTPLIFAIPTFVTGGSDPNEPIRVIQKIIQAGADVNAQNKRNGATALHIAADTGNHAVVKMLIEAKADVNVKDSEGRTPLSVTRNAQVKELLEKAGAK